MAREAVAGRSFQTGPRGRGSPQPGSNMPRGHRYRLMTKRRHSPGIVALSLLAFRAEAADLGMLGGFDVRLDTGVRLSFGLRTDGQDALLLAAVNADDGDRALAPGPISERADVTTTLDLTRGDLGAEISADGWYDAAYHGRNDDRSPGTFNPITVPSDRFPADVRRLMGGAIELGNAYLRDTFDAAGLPVSVRLGRQTLLWGESLFFAQDGIAGAQAPVDLVKIASQPLIEARETYLPVTQADMRVQLGRALSLEAYDQLKWRRDRIPAVASYFSTSDILDTGGQRFLLGNGDALFRARDTTPSGTGQFGVALRYDGGVSSLGMYALRYDAKSPEAEREATGTYRLVFPQGIELLGLTAGAAAAECSGEAAGAAASAAGAGAASGIEAAAATASGELETSSALSAGSTSVNAANLTPRSLMRVSTSMVLVTPPPVTVMSAMSSSVTARSAELENS